MLKLEENTLFIDLPQGKTQDELITLLDFEFRSGNYAQKCAGKRVLINGRLTTGMALYLGHTLAHVCKNVSIWDPKEQQYFIAVWH